MAALSEKSIIRELLGAEDTAEESLLRKAGKPDLYPEELQEEIDSLNQWLSDNISGALSVARTTQSLQEFSEAYATFFAGLEKLDQRLETQRFLLGDFVTESDIRLYTVLAGFDVGASRNIEPCIHRLVDYKNLWPYARDLYQIPAFHHNTDFQTLAASRQEGDRDYLENTFYDLVVPQTDFEGIWKSPSDRERLSKDPANKCRIAI